MDQREAEALADVFATAHFGCIQCAMALCEEANDQFEDWGFEAAIRDGETVVIARPRAEHEARMAEYQAELDRDLAQRREKDRIEREAFANRMSGPI